MPYSNHRATIFQQESDDISGKNTYICNMNLPRVVIVTKFYYRRGGDCVAALGLERMLRDRGHEVAVFAMDYPENLPSQWSTYWPREVSFNAGGVKGKLAAIRRTMGTDDVAARFRRLLADFRPDVVHLHNIHSYLSPVVAREAHKAGVRTVWTLHDYKLICPSYSCLRDGAVCELCFTRGSGVLSTRCMKGSLVASVLAYAEARRWSKSRLQRYTDVFICPSRFMAAKMEQGGFSAEKLRHLCNPLSPDMTESYRSLRRSDSDPGYYCYVGRLSREKGVATLLEAAATLPYRLKVAGTGPLADELRSRYADCPGIEFLGMLDSNQVLELLGGARLSVMPSECYENNPLGVIESLCAGTPVVGAGIGGIPELIDDSRGATFTSGDARSLATAIEKVWHTTYSHKAMSLRALDEFSDSRYYSRLLDIYTE